VNLPDDPVVEIRGRKGDQECFLRFGGTSDRFAAGICHIIEIRSLLLWLRLAAALYPKETTGHAATG
jgi:hypothetical protein